MTDVSQAAETTAAPAGVGHNNPPFSVELAERHAPLKLRVDALIAQGKALPLVIETEDHHVAATAFIKTAAETLAEITTEHTTEKKPLAEKTKVIDEFFLSKGLKGLLEPLKATVASKNGAYQDKLAEARRQAALAEAAKAQAEASKREEEAAKLEGEGRHTEAAVKMEGAVAQETHASNLAATASFEQKDLGRTYTAVGTSSLIITAVPKIDIDTIDLEKLRPFLAIDALETALRRLIAARGLKHQQLLDGALPIKGVTFERKATSR